MQCSYCSDKKGNAYAQPAMEYELHNFNDSGCESTLLYLHLNLALHNIKINVKIHVNTPQC